MKGLYVVYNGVVNCVDGNPFVCSTDDEAVLKFQNMINNQRDELKTKKIRFPIDKMSLFKIADYNPEAPVVNVCELKCLLRGDEVTPYEEEV